MKKFNFIIKIIFVFTIFLSSAVFASVNFSSINTNKISYLDFLLLKIENKLINKSKILGPQMYPTRVQYQNIGIVIHYEKEKITINIKAIMNKSRYTKKKYKQKLSDCNIVRNLILFGKSGYSFTQKKNLSLSEDDMFNIFKESYLNNLSLAEKEIDFLINNMHVIVDVINPANRTQLSCNGKLTDFELK